MGWIEENGCQLSDEAFDRLHESVCDVVSVYRDDLGRDPTIGELESLLRSSLESAASRLEFFDGKAVSQVGIKTKKAARPAKLKLGDVFRGLGSLSSFCGRVILTEKSGTLVELNTLPEHGRISNERLLRWEFSSPTYKYVFDRTITKGDWSLVGSCPVAEDLRFPVFFTLGGDVYRGVEKVVAKNQKQLIKRGEPKIVYGVDPFKENILQFGLGAWPDVEESRKDALSNCG